MILGMICNRRKLVEMAAKLTRQIEESLEKKVSKTDEIVGRGGSTSAASITQHLSVRMMSLSHSKSAEPTKNDVSQDRCPDHTGYSDDEFDAYDESDDLADSTIDATIDEANYDDDDDDAGEKEEYDWYGGKDEEEASCPPLEYEELAEVNMHRQCVNMHRQCRRKSIRRPQMRPPGGGGGGGDGGATDGKIDAPEPLDIDLLEHQLLAAIEAQDQETQGSPQGSSQVTTSAEAATKVAATAAAATTVAATVVAASPLVAVGPVKVSDIAAKKKKLTLKDLSDVQILLGCYSAAGPIIDETTADQIMRKWGYIFPRAFTVYEKYCRYHRQCDLLFSFLAPHAYRIRKLLKSNPNCVNQNTKHRLLLL